LIGAAGSRRLEWHFVNIYLKRGGERISLGNVYLSESQLSFINKWMGGANSSKRKYSQFVDDGRAEAASGIHCIVSA
jgi:hypothetical protein